ncbi:ATP-binding protein [Deminuibacter soli]|uniref:AAA family ATPase n=1 Tax=Deminuibacter soli TaxID=2291815 RepID=A0A3E1NPD1_9BACT|nr:ATP-binding protein [Deminuibacter soli]RFM29684.1 AAA family ATPase [Deminuibacter soli]
MKKWENRAFGLLDKSLHPVPSELNEIDWKSGLSNKTERLAQHISAFSNIPEGGFLAFGINNDGIPIGISKNQIDEIIQQLGQIARNNLSVTVIIDHIVLLVGDQPVLIVHIPENLAKPVFPRGKTIWDSYTRSAGQTVKMSPNEVKNLIALSQGQTFEEQIALPNQTTETVINLIDFDSYFRLYNRPLPNGNTAIVKTLASDDIVKESENGTWDITNLGAITFARNIVTFKNLSRKAVRVIQYNGTNKLHAIHEIEGKRGYASGFEGLITYIMGLLPTNEVIESALRREFKMYPEVAIREFVANALIHQDFSILGTGVLIEIYTDRIEITNPGVPLVDTNRFIDTPPKSRNESMASLLRRLKICEERGSGVDRAVSQIEAFQLPAAKFERGEDYTRVTLYAHMQLTKMEKDDRIRACYQHCCLLYVSNSTMTNQTVRKRFVIAETNYPMASRIIYETLETGLIKPKDATSTSKKHAAYVPFWA